MSPSLQLWRRNDAALDLRNHRHPDRADMGGGADSNEKWGSGMNDWREELIEKMAKAAYESDGSTCDMLLETYLTEFRAALAVAEPVIREQADNALREENARLRGALKPFADRLDELEKMNASKYACAAYVEVEDLRAAAAAILGDVKAEAACPAPDEAP